MAKILLVEDDKSLREIYGVRLLAEGYDIISAGDGEEALAMAIKDRPQLIISDVMMPKISGFDMLDILRSTTETKNIKVIMMTALSSEDQRQRGEQLGADRYLVKSQVGIEDVVRTVHDVLGDVPSASGMAASTAPISTPVPRPTMTSGPTVPPRPTAPSAPAPSQPVPVQTPPAPTPAMSPATATPAPLGSAPTPAPQQPSGLPQPTAPFSTPRPAGLGDRIIQPLERSEEEGEPMADRMNRELSAPHPQAAIPTPPAPTPPNVPPVPAQTPPNVPPVPAQTPPANDGIAFEETERAASNQPPTS